MTLTESTIKIAFIVPYRDREEHKHFFEKYMKYILEDYDPSTYDILYIHQENELPFNRGAMKNIGFLYLKHTYPEHYKEITLVFHDIDTVPYIKNLLDYETTKGVIKHFFGFQFALGGIFSIKGSDFEKIDGFPNYWQWGFEDNVIQKRVLDEKLEIDRSCFYKIGTHKILHFCDAIQKTLNRNVLQNQFDKKYKEEDGLSKLQNVKFKREDSMVHVTNFDTFYSYKQEELINFPVTNGSKITNPKNQRQTKTLLFV
jgi:hypothetical protein